MFIKINTNKDIPIYMQIKQQIISGIASGELKPGDTLPSVRQLANDIGVNMHTVNKAYALLRSEGSVNMHGRRGAVIAERSKAGESYIKEIRAELEMVITEAMVNGVSGEEINEIVNAILKGDLK